MSLPRDLDDEEPICQRTRTRMPMNHVSLDELDALLGKEDEGLFDEEGEQYQQFLRVSLATSLHQISALCVASLLLLRRIEGTSSVCMHLRIMMATLLLIQGAEEGVFCCKMPAFLASVEHTLSQGCSSAVSFAGAEGGGGHKGAAG